MKPETRNVRTRPSLAPAPEREPRAPHVPFAVRYAKLRARFVPAFARARGPLATTLRVAAALAAIAGSVALARLVEKHARSSPAFETRTIDVTGLEHLTRDEVIAAAGLHVGQNVFVVPPEDAEARLGRHPWIATARVERRLPGTYAVRIRERHPAAVLAIGSLYLVADDGVVFKHLAPGDPNDLPVITGVREDDLEDTTERTVVLSSVVGLLDAWRTAGLQRRAPIDEVHVEADHALTVWAGRDPTLVRLGSGPWRAKLSRLRRVWDTLDAQHEHAEYVYLDNVRRPDRVTVRLRDREPLAVLSPPP